MPPQAKPATVEYIHTWMHSIDYKNVRARSPTEKSISRGRETPCDVLTSFLLLDMCFSSLVSTIGQEYSNPERRPTKDLIPTLPVVAEEPPSQPAVSQEQSGFLGLPAELRVAIYEGALLTTLPTLALLQTSRQIAMEAKPTLYQRPLTFESQTQLYDWIERSRSSNLKRVRSLTLRLGDIDLSPLFDSRPQTRTSAWSLYQGEVEKLHRAFSELPNVSDLTITPPEAGHSQLLRSMYLSSMALVPRLYPELKHLTVDDTEAVLEKVPCLTQLSSVSFTVASKVEQSASKERHDSAANLQKKPSKHDTRASRKRRTSADGNPNKSAGRKRRARRRQKPST
ncbi:hypothetical protein LTR85_012110 [Meristemomyces frigidus]|nr:hypothetical protein LTR85_012110 [Meristemomyces frigidus]